MLQNNRIWFQLSIFLMIVIIIGYFKLQSDIYNLQAQIFEGNQLLVDSHSENLDESDDIVIIYNRVPKTGSTSFIGLAYSLCYDSNFHVIHINTSKNAPTLSLSDQARFVHNVSYWEDKKPAIYHGHIAFLDFKRFGNVPSPIYINIIRDPIERLVSYYYFLRYGDDLRPHLVRKRQGDKMTLDDCVERGHPDCSAQHLWLQVPFFCGHYAECWTLGSEWALEQAKHNLVHNYFLVGVTEELEDFVAMLEVSIPRIFKGFIDLFNEGEKSHLRKTVKKIMPKQETIEALQNTKVWRLENEFYMFAKDHFNYIKSKTLYRDSSSNLLQDRGKFFSYEKIKPKSKKPINR